MYQFKTSFHRDVRSVGLGFSLDTASDKSSPLYPRPSPLSKIGTSRAAGLSRRLARDFKGAADPLNIQLALRFRGLSFRSTSTVERGANPPKGLLISLPASPLDWKASTAAVTRKLLEQSVARQWHLGFADLLSYEH